LIAVDARATMGPFISSNNVRKVIEVNEFILGTMAGGAEIVNSGKNMLQCNADFTS